MGQPDSRPSSAGVAWLRDKLILLAEDNITNQMVATQMLDALGARVDVANDGAEALEMIARKPYDLYLVDIEMPRVSGLDVIRSIRASEPPLRDAPVIAVTAYALREHRDKITEAGADGLIPKPLLGIEQFGRDIVTLADRSYERAAATTRPNEANGGEDVDPELFRTLTEAVGRADLAELLSKIDDDLGRAEKSVAAAAENEDRAALGAAAHVLVSVAGAVGAERLETLARRLGDVAEGGAGGDVRALSADALRRIARVRAFVREQSAHPRG